MRGLSIPALSTKLVATYSTTASRSSPRSLPRVDHIDRRGRKFRSTQTFCVGQTPVFSLPELSEHFGVKRLWVKDESTNPFGTHKDRKSLSVVHSAIALSPHQRPQGLCILTAGNAGLSLARVAALFSCDLPITAFISEKGISPTLQTQLETACERVFHLDLEGHEWKSEELCERAGATLERRLWDVTNGVINPYSVIVDEILQLHPEHQPDVIVLPVGCGELFLGVERGLKRRGHKARLIGVTVREGSIADKLYAKWRPHGNHVAELTLNGSPHHLLSLDDDSLLLDTLDWLKIANFVNCGPSSAAAFAALHKIRSGLKPEEKVMVINTGTFRH